MAALALLPFQTGALANVGPAVAPNAHLALPPPVPTNLDPRRIGQTVSLTWAYTGTPKNFYIFHVASAAQPPADFAQGGWQNDTIVTPTTRQVNLSVPAAVKPAHNYYLICIAGAGTAYFCSAVAIEKPSYVVPAPIQRP